ncbi:uncharacterized protein [Primulina eburnea]|uniref:uncharacterized protein n=1 Tax=Primulina eburnea TaxID=1245227 RepID=UPI003C6C8330
MAQSDSPSTELNIQQANKPGLNPTNQYSWQFMREIMREAQKQIRGKNSLQQGVIVYPAKETGIDPMYQYSPPFLRERCDEYVSYPECKTKFDVDKVERVRNAAKIALNVYNQKEQKNFNLEKVVKLNAKGPYLCMTFRAKNAEIDECRLFRGVVNGLGNIVLLCEIKEPDHIAIPGDLDENPGGLDENHVEALSESKEDGFLFA